MSFSREESKSTSLDWRGQRVGQRRFYVDIRDPAGAQNYVQSNDGVAVNGAFPGFSSLLCDVVQDDPAEDGLGTIITATYSTDRRFGSWQKIDKEKAGYYSFDVNCYMAKQKIPVDVRGTVSVKGPDGSTANATVQVWLIEAHDADEPRGDVTVNCSVADWGTSQTSACMAQVGHIHTINGVKYLYKGVRTYQRLPSGGSTPAKWDVTHTWFLDPGSPVVATPDPLKFLYAANLGNGLSRNPYENFVVYPSSDPANTPHAISTYQPHKIASDPSEYLALPGMPNI